MTSYHKNWSPDEWEDYARQLVAQRHGLENTIDVPDKHKGDYGIEAYTVDGIAFQMYAPEGLINVATLYDRQKNKIYTDIKKFIDNKSDLVKLFGNVVIKRWILLTPENKSSELIKYANKKSNEVLSENLPYVHDDFKILIKEENSFKKEQEELINAGLYLINIQLDEVTQNQMDTLETDDSEGISNINNKLNDGYAGTSSEKLFKIKNQLIKDYILGANLLDNLNKEFPEVWEQVSNTKKKREDLLLIESLDQRQTINGEKIKLKEEFIKLNKLHHNNIEQLSSGAISDWIMRCPLDFKQ